MLHVVQPVVLRCGSTPTAALHVVTAVVWSDVTDAHAMSMIAVCESRLYAADFDCIEKRMRRTG